VRAQVDLDQVRRDLLNGKTYQEIAQQQSINLGASITRNTIAGIVRDLRSGKLPKQRSSNPYETYTYGVDDPSPLDIPYYDGHPTLDVDRVIILSDLHIPFTNWDFANYALETARQRGVKTALFAGDVIDAQNKSVFRKRVPAIDLDREFYYAEKFLSQCDTFFDKIYIFPGNHEDRLMKDVGGQFGFRDFARSFTPKTMKEKIVVYEYDRTRILSGEEEWTVFHQANYSKNPLKVANLLAHKYQTHIITTHQHASAKGVDDYGRYVLIDNGGFV